VDLISGSFYLHS